jgi:hypothetical protein
MKYLVSWTQRIRVEIEADSEEKAKELAKKNNPDFNEHTVLVKMNE